MAEARSRDITFLNGLSTKVEGIHFRMGELMGEWHRDQATMFQTASRALYTELITFSVADLIATAIVVPVVSGSGPSRSVMSGQHWVRPLWMLTLLFRSPFRRSCPFKSH